MTGEYARRRAERVQRDALVIVHALVAGRPFVHHAPDRGYAAEVYRAAERMAERMGLPFPVELLRRERVAP